MLQDFVSWMTVLNESGFLSLDPRQGDLVFFGIHLLSKYNRENNTFPLFSVGNSNGLNVSNLVTPIAEIDPINHTVLVSPSRSPHSMGYRHANFKAKDNRVKIPAHQLQNVSFLFPNTQQTVWLLVSDNKYQGNLIRKLRKFEQMNSETPQERVQAMFSQNKQQNQQPPDLNTLLGIQPEPQQPKTTPIGSFINQRRNNIFKQESVEPKKNWKYY